MTEHSQRKMGIARTKGRRKQPARPGWLIPSLVGVLILVAIGGVVAATVGRSPSGPENASQPLAVGDVAPPFTLPQVGGGEFSLAESLKNGPVLLYFSMAGRR